MSRAEVKMALQAFLRFVPFRPFTVELNSGAQIVVAHPEALMLRPDGLLHHRGADSVHSVFDCGSVCRFIGPNRSS